jgi:hypothetical protein
MAVVAIAPEAAVMAAAVAVADPVAAATAVAAIVLAVVATAAAVAAATDPCDLDQRQACRCTPACLSPALIQAQKASKLWF